MNYSVDVTAILKVTIAIPTLNRSGWLREAINSALTQTYENIEVVISDNASEDDTPKVIAELSDGRIKYFRLETRRNAEDNWNNCLLNASGEYITFLSDDDLLEPSYVREMIDLSHTDASAALAHCGMYGVDSTGHVQWCYTNLPERESSRDFVYARLRWERRMFLPGFLCRTEYLNSVGGFISVGYPGAWAADDYAWFRVALLGDVVLGTKRPLWRYRQHEFQLGRKITLEEHLNGALCYTRLLEAMAIQHSLDPEVIRYIGSDHYMRLSVPYLVDDIRMTRRWPILVFLSKLPKYLCLTKRCRIRITTQLLLHTVRSQLWSEVFCRTTPSQVRSGK